MGKKYEVIETSMDQAWSHYVIDTSSYDEPIGAFLNEESANKYADLMNEDTDGHTVLNPDVAVRQFGV